MNNVFASSAVRRLAQFVLSLPRQSLGWIVLTLLALLLAFSAASAQTIPSSITVSGACLSSSYRLTKVTDNFESTGRPAYQGTGSVSINAQTIATSLAVYYEPSGPGWVLAFDGQPYQYAASSAALPPMSAYTAVTDGQVVGTCTGSNSLSVSYSVPALSFSPVALSACSGSATSLSVIATGFAPVAFSISAQQGVTVLSFSPTTYGALITLQLPSVNSPTTYTISVTGDANDVQASARTTITVNPAPQVSITPSSTAICSGQSAQLTALGATTYRWSTQQSTASILATATGTYSVTGTTSGCSGSAAASVTVNPLPTVAITGLSSAYCKSVAAITLTGNPAGGRFTVDGTAATQFNPTTLSAGNHTVIYSFTNGSGCVGTASQDVNVNPLPIVAITGLANAYCQNAATLPLTGSPAGGSFTIDGSPATSFSPSRLSAGTHTVVYSFTNGNGCSSTATQNVSVNPLPVVAITGLANAYCKDATAIPLAGSPTGGSFTIDGTAATQFTPGTLTTGAHTVVYSFTNSSGCSSTATQNVSVNPLPVVAITGLANAYCKDATAIPLTGTPAGGSFTVDGTAATQFNPALLATGSHAVGYVYMDGNGCTNAIVQNVTVNPVPVVSITGLASAYCQDALVVTLAASPSGGRFTVDGTAATQFDPALLLAGVHSVAYSFTNGSGCVGMTVQSVTVNPLPSVAITGLSSAYCKSVAAITLTGNPAGGRFTVDGTAATQFTPGTLSTGAHTVVYSFTSGSGCTNVASQTVSVNPLPFLSITGLANAYCKDAATVTLTGSPSGGSFAIDGVGATSFNPAGLAVGNRSVDYRYTDGNGCANTATQVVTIKAVPPTPTLLTQGGASYPASQSAVTVDLNSGSVNLVVGNCAGSIAWSGPGNASGNGSIITVSTDQAGVFTYRASCTLDGCTSLLATAVVTVGGRLTVLHRDVDNYADNNAIQPLIVLQNQGSGTLALSGLTLRYYLTVEGASALSNLSINYAQVGNQNVRLRYVPLTPAQPGAAGYVEYSFTAGAGALAPGTSSGPIQAYFAKGDYSGLNEVDDYSYASVRDQLVGNLRITAYYNGVLIAGQEPGGVFTPIKALRALTESKNGPSATQINTYLEVRNEGNVAVNYSDLRARYYFTSDGAERLQVEVDEGNVRTQLVALSPAVAGANYYLEITYLQGGQLAPGASTGRVRYRISKPDGGRFDQTNDYSYQEQPSESSSNGRVVVYVGTARVWGSEPSGSVRIGSAEPLSVLAVTVLGNPLRGDVVSLQVSGARAEPLQLQLVSAQGKVIAHKQVATPQAVEQHDLSVAGQGPGVLLLQVSTPTQRQTIRVLKID